MGRNAVFSIFIGTTVVILAIILTVALYPFGSRKDAQPLPMVGLPARKKIDSRVTIKLMFPINYDEKCKSVSEETFEFSVEGFNLDKEGPSLIHLLGGPGEFFNSSRLNNSSVPTEYVDTHHAACDVIWFAYWLKLTRKTKILLHGHSY
ncbi:hypothetical protein ROZALSC1DRAFT_23482, partial [Rozella allomycis CSF55]